VLFCAIVSLSCAGLLWKDQFCCAHPVLPLQRNKGSTTPTSTCLHWGARGYFHCYCCFGGESMTARWVDISLHHHIPGHVCVKTSSVSTICHARAILLSTITTAYASVLCTARVSPIWKLFPKLISTKKRNLLHVEKMFLFQNQKHTTPRKTRVIRFETTRKYRKTSENPPVAFIRVCTRPTSCCVRRWWKHMQKCKLGWNTKIVIFMIVLWILAHMVCFAETEQIVLRQYLAIHCTLSIKQKQCDFKHLVATTLVLS